MFLSEGVIETATRIFYSIPEVSGDLKVFWSFLMKAMAVDELNDSQLEQREIIGASQPYRDFADAQQELLSKGDLEQDQIIACLVLSYEEANALKDRASERALQKAIDQLPKADVKDTVTAFGRRLDVFQKRQQFFVNGNVQLLSIDFILKWCVLIGLAFAGIDPSWTIVGALIISISSLIVGWRLSRAHQKKNIVFLKTQVPGLQWRISVRYSRAQYTVLFVFAILSSIIAFVLTRENNLLAGVTTFFVVTSFYYIMLAIFPMGKLTADDLAIQLQEVSNTSEFDADENDEAIVKLETQLQSQTSRLEAYVLESALFGALAFSGFLQIIASNLISFDDLENFASSVFHTLHGLLTGQTEELHHYAATLDTKESLFCLVSIETLICSGLFLAVIASRLRFSNFADSLRTYLSLAIAYNQKEEGIIQQNPAEMAGRRFLDINRKVNLNVRKATAEFKNIAPVVSYMEYFRHAGVLVFLLVLVTSCLFVSTFLGWMFVVAALVTTTYFNLKSIRKGWKQNLFSFKVFFARNAWQLFIGCFLLGPIAFWLRVTLNPNFTDLLLLISLDSLSLLLYAWLVLMPHHDKKFGDIENLKSEPWRSSRYKVVKTIYGLSAMCAVFGLSLKITGTAGADELLMIGLAAMGLASYALGYYLSRPKWLGLFSGLLIGTSAIGTLFTTLHLIGGGEMLNIAIGAQILFFIFFFVRRKSFHYILFRVIVIMAVVTFLVSGNPSYLRQMSLMYEHGSTDMAILAGFYNQTSFDEPRNQPELIKRAIVNCDNYFQTFDISIRATSIHREWPEYFAFITNGLLFEDGQVTKDSARLNLADLTSAQLQKINQRMGYHVYPLLRPTFLLAMRRKKEAMTTLEAYMSRFPAKTYRDDVQNLHTQILQMPDSLATQNVVSY